MDPKEAQEIAEKVRSGEYFQETRRMYDMMVHDPMAERYLYILITVLAAAIFWMAFLAAQGLYPLNNPVPFIFYTNDPVEDLPRIKQLQQSRKEDPGEALLKYMVENYVTFRESYSVSSFDRYVNGVVSQSSEEVASVFRGEIDPSNPQSPVALYQRHSGRRITVVSSQRLEGQEFGMEVIFDATVESKVDAKKTRWQANIAFQYSGLALDEEGKIKPVSFVVTRYQTRRL